MSGFPYLAGVIVSVAIVWTVAVTSFWLWRLLTDIPLRERIYGFQARRGRMYRRSRA